MHTVLFICTANVCRSPLAAALLRERVKDSAQDWRIESAGTWALEGYPMVSKVEQVLNERGVPIPPHRSRKVTAELLQQFQLILTMEEGHKEALRFEFPEAASRIYMLSEMINQRFNVPDPMGKSYREYKITAQELDRVIEKGLEKISQLSQSEGPSLYVPKVE
ncbi:MAG: low molecular weight protein arginine phosphatase [Chloroflexi bacterium]|jgi:protein-tyrosine-phosphatase|nr:low molecular weight protein arginine phosphatase [Chloroflexota bacterium]